MKQIPTCLKGMAAVLTVIAMTMVLTPAGLMAQDVAVGTATATVLAALQVTAGQALDFGNVYQGVAKSVAKNDASAGVFTIAGQSLSQVSIYMQMPEFMATASGDDRMSLAFGTQDAHVDTTANAAPNTPGAGYPNVNPRSFPTVTLRQANGTVHIFIGGRVTPSINQKAGAYTADVILTVAYIGS
jgi:hypothetical protein